MNQLEMEEQAMKRGIAKAVKDAINNLKLEVEEHSREHCENEWYNHITIKLKLEDVTLSQVNLTFPE